MTERAMATLTVRNVEPSVRDRLRVRAARNGRSMEAELRVIIGAAIAEESKEEPVALRRTGADLLADIRAIFEPIGFADDLVIPPRGPGRPPPTFDE